MKQHDFLDKVPLFYLEFYNPKLNVDVYRCSHILNVPSDAHSYNNNYYKAFDESIDWYEAKAHCEEMGGHLITVTSIEEQSVLDNILNGCDKNSYWLGGHKVDGSFVWITGENFSYTNWSWGQPDNHNNNNENVILAYNKINSPAGNKQGQWNDLLDSGFCDDNDTFFGLENIGFICEWENPHIYTDSCTVTETESMATSCSASGYKKLVCSCGYEGVIVIDKVPHTK